MRKNIQSIRGVKDYFPNELKYIHNIESALKQVLHNYGYHEIRLPILEKTELFQRSVGNLTDIINKEMYSFQDKRGNNITLRPEATAGCVRAGIQNNLFKNNQIHRFWYLGPMFRYERPQYGRYRQFYQLGVEVFGLPDIYIELELIMMLNRCWKLIGIDKYLNLEINSIGSDKSRKNFCNKLIDFLKKHENLLDKDNKKKIYKNPLRILDTKNPDVLKLLKKAPKILDYLDFKSKDRFKKLCNLMKLNNITYKVNNNLVRGLDYYNDIVFEWKTMNLGSQDTICAGGRYDSLSYILGGNNIPAIGLAIGIDRLSILYKLLYKLKYNSCKNNIYDLCLISLEEELVIKIIQLSEHIRNIFPKISILTILNKGKIGDKLSYANKIGVKIAIILGKREFINNTYIIKNLQKNIQKTVEKKLIEKELNNFFYC
ncbi:histidine--tRNA ligase [Buchnera aphidicola (Neophyllaphis podocarpi)]|uniref:histidine--tRNA ligase n=1 Tax=Buchnera aphidicola TaxID=9 RepID=UPI0031B847B1